MAETYSYRPPLGFDIRVKPPKEEAKQREEDRVCDSPGCKNKGVYPAPRATEAREYQFFCLDHVREFNKSWNFFKEMKDDDVRDYIKDGQTGHRPTWKMGTGPESAASAFAKFKATGTFDGWNGLHDDHQIFGKTGSKSVASRSLTRAQKEALETMDLDETATQKEIKLRYKDLVKRYHPDSNGGDTTTIERLKNVIKAYHTLKASGLPEN